MWSRRVRCALACATVAAPALLAIALQASQDAPSPTLSFQLRPLPEARRQRIVDTTGAALTLLTEWFGPLPSRTLNIVDHPWFEAEPVVAGTVDIQTRWWSIDADPVDERTLIRRLARQFWLGVQDASGPNAAFGEGLIHYSSVRAIDTLLQGQQYWSARFFGGFVPYAVRSLTLSPIGGEARGHVPRFDIVDYGYADAERVEVGLFTLERSIGWPALQQGLAAYRQRYRQGGGSAQGLAAIVDEQLGRDLSWFVDETFGSNRRFDYGVEQFTSTPEGSRFHVSIVLRKFGDATFAAPNASATTPMLPVQIALTDGTVIREWWNGRESPLNLEYTTASPAAQVTVDPDAILLLDADRSNNTRRLIAGRPNPSGVRSAAAWFTWLQDLMLTCTALV